MIMKRRNRQIKMRILNRVCRSDQAADRTAPHGPPTAVPAAIPDTALPASTPAFTVAAAALAAASPQQSLQLQRRRPAGGGAKLPRCLRPPAACLADSCPAHRRNRCSSDKGITSLMIKGQADAPEVGCVCPQIRVSSDWAACAPLTGRFGAAYGTVLICSAWFPPSSSAACRHRRPACRPHRRAGAHGGSAGNGIPLAAAAVLEHMVIATGRLIHSPVVEGRPGTVLVAHLQNAVGGP